MAANRLRDGGRINRNEPLRFSFDGRALTGFAGDTLASALLANDVSIVGRSFKYHRPRGIVGAGAEEPNAIMQIGRGAATEPNLRATQVELYDGLEAFATKGWPSVNLDLAVVNDWLGKIFGAGFYYKTFMQPAGLWPFYERLIRRSAGFGHAPAQPDPDYYDQRNVHCDVLVVGAGPAGLAAAVTAARAGARVVIADDQNEFGGALLSSSARMDGAAPTQWVARQVAELARHEEVTCLPRSTVFGYFDYNFLTIAQRCTNHLGQHVKGQPRQRLWRVRAREVILAQGAFERPLVFCNNDRPGTMLASAVSTYIQRYAVCPGERAVVFTNNDGAYQAALDLNAAGAEVAAVVDSRPAGAGALAQRVEATGITVHRGCVVNNVRGRRRVGGVDIAPLGAGGDITRVDCDLLAMSGGWSPAVHLHSQAGGRNDWNRAWLCFVPGAGAQRNRSVGAGNGTFDLEGCVREGTTAAVAALGQCGFTGQPIELPQVDAHIINPAAALWRVPHEALPEQRPKQFVDYQNDTTVSDIRLAVREGFANVEHVKRYTALGFGTDQGKLGNINGMALVAECLDKTIEEVGTTTFRPAYTPVTFGTCAGGDVGALYEPVRKTALHEAHSELGAPFEVVGQWLRPWYFPQGAEDLHAAVARECLAVRNSVGVMDASTLGKIDVRGPDAVTFLERIYTHDIARMAVGRCAYGIMLGEDGMIMDDGVMARVGADHFYLTTTTGGAANVLSWLELWLQTEWPDLNVYLTSLTDHYSTIALAGPNSRRVLEAMDCDIDLSADAFGFMARREGHLGRVPVQLYRVSFSGELAFEINVDSNYARHVWDALFVAGREYGITPYGTETMHVLRAEKGFVIVGQDTDGSVTPVDLRMNWLLAKDKDFLGKRSLSRPDTLRADRKQWVGLLSVDGTTVVPEGAALVSSTPASRPWPIEGHVTSSYASATLGHPIALGLIRAGSTRKDEVVIACSADGSECAVRIVAPVFYDPRGQRQNV